MHLFCHGRFIGLALVCMLLLVPWADSGVMFLLRAGVDCLKRFTPHVTIIGVGLP